MGNHPALCRQCPCADEGAAKFIPLNNDLQSYPAFGDGATTTPSNTNSQTGLVEREPSDQNRSSWDDGNGDDDDYQGPLAPPPGGDDNAGDAGEPLPPPTPATPAPAERPPPIEMRTPLKSPGRDEAPMRSPGREDDGNSSKVSGGKSANDWQKDQEQFAHLPPLPEGWIRVKSGSTGNIYYFNVNTGKSTFSEPTAETGGAASTTGSGSELPAGWTQVQSKSTGKFYYWNATLNKSQFEVPTA